MVNIEKPDSPAAASAPRASRGRRHSSSRERVLREVEARGEASTAEIVAATGLHENTVRGHLDQLEADGYVERTNPVPSGRGRPALRYAAVDAAAHSPYAELAIALADTLAASVPAASGPTATGTVIDPAGSATASGIARRAGAEWGERLAAKQRGPTRAASAHNAVVEHMRGQGFAPERAESPRGDVRIILRRCPLLAASSRNPGVVCAVHEGMIEAIARSVDPGARAAIEPFRADGTCLARIEAAS